MEQQIQAFFESRYTKIEAQHYINKLRKCLAKNLQIKLLCENPWYLNQLCLISINFDVTKSTISIPFLLETFLLHHLYNHQHDSNEYLGKRYILRKYSAAINFLEKLAFDAELKNSLYVTLPKDADPDILNVCLQLQQIYPEKGMFNNFKNFYFPQPLIQHYYVANYIAKHCAETNIISFLENHTKEFWVLIVVALGRLNRISELRLIFEKLILKIYNNEITALEMLLKCYDALYADSNMNLNVINIFKDIIDISTDKLNIILRSKTLNDESKQFLHLLSQTPSVLESMNIDSIFINYLEEKQPDLTDRIWSIMKQINYFNPIMMHRILNHFKRLGIFHQTSNSNLYCLNLPLDIIKILYNDFQKLIKETILSRYTTSETKILMIRAYIIGSQSEWVPTDAIFKWLYLALKYKNSDPLNIFLNKKTVKTLQKVINSFDDFTTRESFLTTIEKTIPNIPLLIYAKDNTAIRKVIAALDQGADINARDDQGKTALHIACIADAHEVIQTLLARGIDYTLRDYKGRTAFHINRDIGRGAIIHFLDEKFTSYADKVKILTEISHPIEFNISTKKNSWPKLFFHSTEKEAANGLVRRNSFGLKK